MFFDPTFSINEYHQLCYAFQVDSLALYHYMTKLIILIWLIMLILIETLVQVIFYVKVFLAILPCMFFDEMIFLYFKSILGI